MNMRKLEEYADILRTAQYTKRIACSWCDNELFDCPTPRWHAIICTILGRELVKIKEVK